MELEFFDIAAILLMLAAAFGLLNHHLVKLPVAIGLMVASLAASLVVMGVDVAVPALGLGEMVREGMMRIDFTETLLEGMLGFLLFAGALHTDIDALRDEIGAILSLASVGLLLSTGIVGGASWYLFGAFGHDVPLIYCLVFGALISPTDPVAVLGIIRAAGAPEEIEVKIVGESLFNDGFAVVLFSVLLGIAVGGGHGHGAEAVSAASILGLLGKEVLGGLVLGFAGGFLVYRAMNTLDEPNLEILLSVALVMGVSFVAFEFHLSAPLACVAAGLLIGNRGRTLAMSDRTRRDLDIVWNFLDETLNALLFLLIGLEVVAIPVSGATLVLTLLLIPVTIGARFAAVAGPLTVLQLRTDFRKGARRVLTWGGLKGGISIALAMSLPEFPGREAVVTSTYGIVVFSVLAQGLTVGKLIERILGKKPA
jgi:CPA1 family monovalent cation:H+ antiporter